MNYVHLATIVAGFAAFLLTALTTKNDWRGMRDDPRVSPRWRAIARIVTSLFMVLLAISVIVGIFG